MKPYLEMVAAMELYLDDFTECILTEIDEIKAANLPEKKEKELFAKLAKRFTGFYARMADLLAEAYQKPIDDVYDHILAAQIALKMDSGIANDRHKEAHSILLKTMKETVKVAENV